MRANDITHARPAVDAAPGALSEETALSSAALPETMLINTVHGRPDPETEAIKGSNHTMGIPQQQVALSEDAAKLKSKAKATGAGQLNKQR